jgi:hypothetical protein
MFSNNIYHKIIFLMVTFFLEEKVLLDANLTEYIHTKGSYIRLSIHDGEGKSFTLITRYIINIMSMFPYLGPT